MTARTLFNRLHGDTTLYAEIMRRAGVPDNTRRKMLDRDTPLATAHSPERGKRIVKAAREIRDELTALIRDLEKE